MREESDGDEPSLESTSVGAHTDAPLAVIVDKPRTETAIESLRVEGVYDDSRRVREDGPDRVALPVTEPPSETDVLEVVRQVDPEPRTPDLEDRLADRGWDEDALAAAPGSWAVVGSVVLVSVPDGCPDETELAEALLELHGEADSVLANEGIANDGEAGTCREPRTRLLAGDPDTETIHAEHGTRYGLDPAKVMFSPGNQAERARMGEVVHTESRPVDSADGPTRTGTDEHVFDMFAGIGYFTLPMARAGARVTAAEINPTAFRNLLENAVLNDVDDRVDAYMTDCRELTSDVDADRVVMGYYGSAEESADEESTTDAARTDEAHEFLPTALEALVPGGVIHYHEATPESLLWDRPLERLERAATAAGRELEVVGKRRVKSHSAGVSHVVLDGRFE
ncbi:class I SAM-dependent methyltransferase [Natrarchaeobius chitinivorans]|uniref:tRNA(Phe) (4-demethylwyosine(37)-C(7)) aminocarboxypropyltransferase n=1 Tax=Natrarchaeobius chitinivorans TaxID=1679083 RepID=A0A3N6LUP3_NATCH|nr:class I SAM-dependent methyltransferase family protein [Natrarchaeobius chitinivorans]RQG94003.1 class I SAM-dependent methyltransferase family protein [Natrarchaeobius chitinivorans]